MPKESVTWTQRIGGNKALVLVVMILILILFTVEGFVLPSFGVGNKAGDFVRFTVNGRAVILDKSHYDNLIGDWQKYQMGESNYTRGPRGGPDEFLNDVMLAELAKDAGLSVTDGSLREFIQSQFEDSSGEFDPKAFDRALQERYGGMRPRAYEEQVRLALLIDHLKRLYVDANCPADEGESYKRWKGDYPKIEVAYAWKPVAPIRAGMKVEDLKPEEVEAYWRNLAVQDRHKLPRRVAFEAAALRVSEVDDQAYRDAREAWKADADLQLKKDAGGDEAYDLWFQGKKYDFPIQGQSEETINALRKENEAAVKKEDEEAGKDPRSGPKDPAAPETPIDLSKLPPDKLEDREQYRRYWRFRVEKDLWLKKVFQKALKEAKDGNKTLAEIADKWSRPGLKIRVHVQAEPIDQYAVEKIPGFGSSGCDLRFALNDYKPDQAGTYHPEILYLTAAHDDLAQRGWEIARVSKVVLEEVPPMDTVKDKVALELLDDRARDRARSELEALRKAAEDSRKTLEDAAKEKGIDAATAGPFNAYSWRPPTPRPAPGKEAPAADEGWKDPNRRLSAIMSRYSALRDTPLGAFGPVLDDAAGTGAFYLAQAKSRSEPRYEEMTQAQVAQVRKVLTRERLGNLGMELSYARLKDRLGLLINGEPARDAESRRRGN
jgi:hypothetical protein